MRAVLAVLALAAGPAAAEQATLTGVQAGVVGCLLNVGAHTAEAECTAMMFAPCMAEAPGSAGHAACLGAQHRGWQQALHGQLAALSRRLSAGGTGELRGQIGLWLVGVADKCGGVAAAQQGAAAEAAQLGCEIAGIAGAMAEFSACEQGMSQASYCVFRE